ncbi:choice-of-anchor D domain-containing protein [Chryseobacterium gotjawalense]|uniref:Choice-of-anchor D domain-containing protein n=1 Tax=Chryseobacterium gotjawalense TaxID=3042315 RepID=A0ABY8RIJ2_9FLAO|nr:choice-of-anchor D domain-containing protein [Chryseobacterium sp. wdc7]WHF53079.1 choice-of-anchor D domain-containing protein [Chryseobacterium sp. wdc7]
MKKYLLYFYRIIVLFAVLFSAAICGQISMSTTGSYQQDFNTLISTGTGNFTDNTTLPNWYAQRTGTGSTIVANTGSSTSGNLYSYGSGDSDRALGSLGSGTTGNFAWGTLLQNNSPYAITDIRISYTGEQWRNSAAEAQTVAFYYKISSLLSSDLQPNVNEGWTAVTYLDFTSPVTGGTAGVLDGNNAANRVVKNSISIPSIMLPTGSYILLKWDDPDHIGNDHGLSIDDVKIEWTVNSVAQPEPTNFPINFSCGVTTHSTIPLSWTDAAGTTPPDGYLIRWSSTSYTDIADPQDGTAAANGTNTQNVLQGTQTFTASGLSPNTAYFFKIWSYTNSGTAIDYKLVGEPKTSCATLAPPCNFSEDFSKSNAKASYTDGSFVGNNSIVWTYTKARDEGDFGINGKGIMLHTTNSKIISSSINNGISSFTCSLKKGFTGAGNRQVELLINGVSVGSSVAWDNADVQTFTINNLNIAGSITIEIRNSKNEQVVIDDLSWICFTGTPKPRISIQGNGVTITDGDTSPSAVDGTDFGTAILSGTEVVKTFTLHNVGSADLVLDDPAVVLLDGSKGFTVSAQPAVNPIPGFSNQIFKIKFNNAVPGTYTETVMIGSNDADTPVYSFDVKAIVSQPAITLGKTALSGFSYPFGQGPSVTQNFVVNGVNLGEDIRAEASSDWEISTNQTYDGGNAAPFSSIVFSKSLAGAVTNKTIHVRLKDGLEVGSYAGTVRLTSSNAATKVVMLRGQVVAGVSDMKVTGNGSSIANGSMSPNGLNNTLFASQNLGDSQTKAFEIKNLGGYPLTIGAITLSGPDASSFSVLNGPAAGTVLNQNGTATFEIKFAPTAIGAKNATLSVTNNDPKDNPYVFAVRGAATYCSSVGEIIIARQNFETVPASPAMNYTLTHFGTIAPGPNTGFSSGNSGSNSFPKANNLYSEGARGYRIQGADPLAEIPSGVTFIFDEVDTSIYDHINLSFKIAGFSLGSTGNGMDDLDASNTSTAIHADKLDYVLVEVSPDGGATWYPQAKVVSGEMNLAWSFGSAGTATGTRAYTADNHLTYFSSTAKNRYSAISITGLPAVAKLKLRISAQDNALNESWILDDVRITSTGLVPKIWNGAWFPSAPQTSDKAIIQADYNTADFGGFKVCQCEIGKKATLTVAAGTEVKISDFMVNDGSVIVQNKGNLIQVNESDTNSGAGNFKAEQLITLSAGRQQYNYLHSPAEGFNMKDLYKNARDENHLPVTAPFVLYHNEGTNTFLNSSGAYIKGRALAVKEPAIGFAPAQITAVFEGRPTNGTFIYTLVNSYPANIQRGYNLIGNPYSSNMDLVQFYQNNVASGKLSSTFYLWDHNANLQTAQFGDSYGGQAYAQFNAATPAGVGTPVKASGDAGTSVLKTPSRYVSVGQGFMAKLTAASSQNIIFSNSTRSSGSSQAYFGKGAGGNSEKAVDRFWLNMISPQNIASNIAIVYSEKGTDGFTEEDSRSMGGSDALYSCVEGEKLSVNGKSGFMNTDAVELGTAHFAAGNYTIALDKAEGIFEDGQNIYLKDRKTVIITSLSQGSYSFAADAGETTGRFEIVYQPEIILVTDRKVKEGILVYQDAGDFVIRAQTEKITQVEVYDAVGRLVYKIQPEYTRVVIPGHYFVQGLYILKIHQKEQLTVKKIVR